MFAFPRLHKRDQHIQPISLGRVASGAHQSLDFLENLAIVTIDLIGAIFMAEPQTLCASNTATLS
jgi:hypothetical protein